MVDFLIISTDVDKKKETVTISPDFRLYPKSKDLMIRGGDFYAIWLEDQGLWSINEADALRVIDYELEKKHEEMEKRYPDYKISTKYMRNSKSGSIDLWHKYCQKQARDSYHTLDQTLIFSNDKADKKQYASKRLEYPLEKGDYSSWDKIVSTLYSEEEKHKIEWAIGSIVTGESKTLQKFMVFYGAAGTGKSTILNVIQELFKGYYAVFDAKALGSASAQFALEPFKTNPLVGIQHDGDLSRIEDNTRINSLVSHEEMTINEKHKNTYTNKFGCFLFMGTNQPVKITDAKSGLTRRLIDVHPSGNKIPRKEYNQLVKQVNFELGAIAWHCKEVYLDDPGYYDDYTPKDMMSASNDFYNFVIDAYSVFKKEDSTTLKAAWEMYKTYCDEARVAHSLNRMKFKEELKNYFWEFEDRFDLGDGSRVRSYYSRFRTDKFDNNFGHKKKSGEKNSEKQNKSWLEFTEQASIFDTVAALYLAQYANSEGTPKKAWDKVKTTLSGINTSKLHYVKVPEYHIVIDFDIKNEKGEKDYALNFAAASKWPATYAELSKSGAGIHLHYIYTGDVSRLNRLYAPDIEIKVYTGNMALRRKLTKCNNLEIATISSGLPLKGDDDMIDFDGFKNEKALRTLIKRNLNKEYHPDTSSSINFIFDSLEKAYKSGMKYDVSDMQNAVFAFAAQSTNQSDRCIKQVGKMKFKSDEASDAIDISESPIVFYDIEVFPNLFLVNWKIRGEDKPVIRMINPKPEDIEKLLQYKLVGFNNRRYDNHILYAALMGYSNEQLYNLSQKIINTPKGEKGPFFGEAYNISYTDIYDFAAKKQSLKKWEIELGITHKELGLPWDQPVPEDRWLEVAEYCDNDVIATEAVFEHLKGDFTARQILAEVAGMSVNDTTNSLTTRIIFGKEKNPVLIYTDLATGERTDGTFDKAFPGYEYVYDEADKQFHNMYRGTDVGKGGYVYAEPGMYGNVALLDVASMHPNSAINLNAFGEYTQRFKDILDTRIAIKHGDYETARSLFGGRLASYLDDESTAKDLAQALKIAINSVYGLTSASFANPFRDPRNKNNIVALRGALFMRTLQDEVQKRGFTVVHIKTDSIKIADATPEIIQFVMDFGKEYGYTFEHEATYERMCLVNDAVYIAKYQGGKHDGEWTATGKQFAVPYVYKSLFSKEPIEFDDMCETFSVKSALYLDMNESLPDVTVYETEHEKLFKKINDPKRINENMDVECARLEELSKLIEEGHSYQFIGKVGRFCPIRPGMGGGLLMREQNGKYYAATGTTGFRWMESEVVDIDGNRDAIDISYYTKLVDDAIDTIRQYGDFDWFVSDEPYVSNVIPNFMNIPEDAPEELPFDL